MADTCLVSGTARDSEFLILPGQPVIFDPVGVPVHSSGAGIVVRTRVQVVADGAGAVSVAIVPGEYNLQTLRDGQIAIVPCTVPDQASASLGDCIAAAGVPPTPDLIQQAFDARDDALTAAAAADADRIAAEAARDVAVAAGRVRYFVDPAGSDTNGGTTPAAAFATPSKAASVVRAGDVVHLKRGAIWREMPDFSGSPGVTICAYGAGKRPILSAWDVVSSFTIHGGGPAYTFSVTLGAVAVQRGYAAVFEDGIRLREVKVGDTGIADSAAAIAYVAANPGWYYFAGPGSYAAGWSAGAKTYYVHASDGGNPASNGKTYEVYAREYAAELGSDNIWQDVVFQMGYGHNGLSQSDGQKGRGYLKGCAAVYAGQHATLFNDATFENHEVIGSLGTAFHANPDTSGFGVSTVLGAKVIGDERGTFDGALTSTAFYTHGDFDNATIQKEGWIFKDVEARNVAVLFSHPDCRTVRVQRGKFQNFSRITPQGANNNVAEELTFEDSEFWHSSRVGVNDRILYVGDSATATFRRCYVDLLAQHFVQALPANNLGATVLDESTLVIRFPYSATKSSIVRQEGAGGSGKTVAGLTLKNSTVIYTDYPQGYLVSAPVLSAITVDNLLIVAPMSEDQEITRDPTLLINGTEVALSSLDPDARVVTIDASRAIASDQRGEKIRLKSGVWQPGYPIVSGAAYSEDGSQQPRCHIAVGDKMWRMSNGASNPTKTDVVLASPTAHLNAVHFCNSGASTRAFVAVGEGGAVYTTDINGTNPVARTSGVATALRAVWGHTSGVVVAVGDGGVIIRSTDTGATWATVTSGTAQNLYGVASDGTTWVAVGAAGTVGTSTDAGVTWTWGTQGSNTYRAAIWSNALSLFLIGGDEGTIRTSPATIGWTSRTSNTLQQVRCFAETPGGVVAGLYQTKLAYNSSFIVTANGTDWEFSPTTLPFEVRAIAGPGTSLYETRGIVAVGESAFGAMVQSPLKGEPWKIARLFGGDGRTPAQVTAAQALDMLA